MVATTTLLRSRRAGFALAQIIDPRNSAPVTKLTIAAQLAVRPSLEVASAITTIKAGKHGLAR